MQELLGHRNISTTQNYLGVNYADARAAVEAIALISESDRSDVFGRDVPMLLGSSIKNTPDETLFLELALRGYDLSRLRDPDENTGEVVKIG